jgi:hypothetical protein
LSAIYYFEVICPQTEKLAITNLQAVRMNKNDGLGQDHPSVWNDSQN